MRTAGIIVGIAVGGMEGWLVSGTAKACSEVSERDVLGAIGIPNNVPYSLTASGAGEVAPRLLGDDWIPSGAGRLVGLGPLFDLPSG